MYTVPYNSPLYAARAPLNSLSSLRPLYPAEISCLTSPRRLCNHQGVGYGLSSLTHNHGCGGLTSGCGHNHSHEHHHCHGDRRGRDYSPFNGNPRPRSRSRSRDRGCSHSHSSSRLSSSLYDRRHSLCGSNNFSLPAILETRDRCCPEEIEFRASLSWNMRDLEDNLAREFKRRAGEVDFYIKLVDGGEIRLSEVARVDDLMYYWRQGDISYLLVVERR